MKKFLIMTSPFIVIIASVLWCSQGLKGMLMTFGTTLCVVVPLAFLLAKWIEFVETNIKD